MEPTTIVIVDKRETVLRSIVRDTFSFLMLFGLAYVIKDFSAWFQFLVGFIVIVIAGRFIGFKAQKNHVRFKNPDLAIQFIRDYYGGKR